MDPMTDDALDHAMAQYQKFTRDESLSILAITDQFTALLRDVFEGMGVRLPLSEDEGRAVIAAVAAVRGLVDHGILPLGSASGTVTLFACKQTQRPREGT